MHSCGNMVLNESIWRRWREEKRRREEEEKGEERRGENRPINASSVRPFRYYGLSYSTRAPAQLTLIGEMTHLRALGMVEETVPMIVVPSPNPVRESGKHVVLAPD